MAAPKVLDVESINYMHDELYQPRISKKEDMNFVPRKYSFIKKLIPVVLDLVRVDYNTWSALFRKAARDHNLLHHIDPTVPAPSLTESSMITRRVDDDDTFLWRRQNLLLLTWIYATITPYLLAQITIYHVSSAMEAWARIRDLCQEYNTNVDRKKRRFIHRSDVSDDCDHRVDLISGLPDDVLIYVLNLTRDMKTAGRTSILSKRWRHVWTHIMGLDFYDPETSASLRLTSYPQPEMDKFVGWVNRVISANRAPYLDTLRIHMPLNSSYGAHIQNWVQFAFVKEVHNLKLSFGPNVSYTNYPRINFSDILSTNGALVLNSALKSLCLKNMIIEGPLLQWVLTNCHNLQRLSLHSCRAASSEDSQELVVSSLQLKHLKFSGSLRPLNFQILRVFAPNLTSFLCSEADIDVEYRSISSLVDATFAGNYLPPSDILSAISSQLEKLSITWHRLRSAYGGFPTLVNLQQLEIVLRQMDYDLIRSISLIEACPMLHTFKLKLMYRCQPTQIIFPNYPDKAQKNAIRCHQLLKTVEYLGYAGCAIAAELAIWLAHHAPMLETFIFHTRRPQPETIERPRTLWGSRYGHPTRVKRSVIEHLAERIQGTQSRVNVVIL